MLPVFPQVNRVGGTITNPASHTTVHAGPHTAVHTALHFAGFHQFHVDCFVGLCRNTSQPALDTFGLHPILCKVGSIQRTEFSVVNKNSRTRQSSTSALCSALPYDFLVR